MPLLDELRYALGDVPARTDDERDLDETGLLEGGHDMQELITASDREYAPAQLAFDAQAYVEQVHRVARSAVLGIPPRAADALEVGAEHGAQAIAQRLAILRADVQRVLVTSGAWLPSMPVEPAGASVISLSV